jgi:aminotransferase
MVRPGDEVILFEPAYDSYAPAVEVHGGTPVYVQLTYPDYAIDWHAVQAAITPRTRMIIVNTPNNPTASVFSAEDLRLLEGMLAGTDVVVVSDEVYEHIVFDGHTHVSMAAIEGMRERTVTINSLSKTFSVTGWRVGWTIAPADIAGAIRKVHEQLTVGPAAPLQAAGAMALGLPESYFHELAAGYRSKRDRLLGILEAAGFVCYAPRGAYYIMTDITGFGFPDDDAFAMHLVTKIGVAAVPGSAFYRASDAGRTKLRFCFCKKDETLAAAEERLSRL